MRMKLSAVPARLLTMLLCAGMALPLYFVTKVHSEWAAIALLSLAAAAHQGWSANLYTTASDMFPSTAVGSVVGLGGMAGAVGGALFAELVGRVLQATHSYGLLFAGAASVYLIAIVVLQVLAPRLRRVQFGG
jgi:ACS family hexuronate transporter-like MFS transporter